jgi:hypothetical protein
MCGLAVLLFIFLTGGTEAFRICAFNAQRLTLAKVAREEVIDALVRVSFGAAGIHAPKDYDTKLPTLPDQGHIPE